MAGGIVRKGIGTRTVRGGKQVAGIVEVVRQRVDGVAVHVEPVFLSNPAGSIVGVVDAHAVAVGDRRECAGVVISVGGRVAERVGRGQQLVSGIVGKQGFVIVGVSDFDLASKLVDAWLNLRS